MLILGTLRGDNYDQRMSDGLFPVVIGGLLLVRPLRLMLPRWIIWAAILAAFIGAATLADVGEMQRIPGALLIVAGTLAIVFAQRLAPAQWPTEAPIVGFLRFRPLTARLWGVGVVIVGFAWLFL